MPTKMKSRRQLGRADDVPMTPMIDVVFNLLVFFVFSYDPVDIFSKLDVLRPKAEPHTSQRVEFYTIAIGPRVGDSLSTSRPQYSINHKRAIDLEGLDVELEIVASTDPDQTISFISSPEAIHQDLVDALDLCAKHGLKQTTVLPIHHGDRR